MQTGPLGPRRNRITENAENCDVCFNCFLEGSLNPKKKWKTENSSPSLTWLWSEVLSAGKPEMTRLRPHAVRTGNCSGPSKEAGAVTASIRDIWSVAGLATGRWLVILLCSECPLGAVGGTGHLCTEEGEEQLPGKVAPHSLSLPKAMHFLQACLQPPVSLPAHRRSVLILNLTLLLSF